MPVRTFEEQDVVVLILFERTFVNIFIKPIKYMNPNLTKLTKFM